jgi:hypothetical protein
MAMIDETIRMTPEIYAGSPPPVVVEVAAGGNSRIDITIPAR